MFQLGKRETTAIPCQLSQAVSLAWGPEGRALRWMDLSLALCCPDGSLSQQAPHQKRRHLDVTPRLPTPTSICTHPSKHLWTTWGETRGWWCWSLARGWMHVPGQRVEIHFTLKTGRDWIIISCHFWILTFSSMTLERYIEMTLLTSVEK